MSATTPPHQWHHAKHDCLLPRWSSCSEQKDVLIALPVTRQYKKAVVQAVFDGTIWWFNGIFCTPEKLGDYANELNDARILVNTEQERDALCSWNSSLDCVVLDHWLKDIADDTSMQTRIAQLQARITHCQNTLRVDFLDHASILAAWKWRNLRKIRKRWPFELQSTQQWLQGIDDRPWQETRMAYDVRDRAGAVLDINSAYATALECMLFPKPGCPWQLLRPGQRSEHAMHCLVWEPKDAVGRFYHPFWYSVRGTHALPGYMVGDSVHAWVLDDDLPWLQRHGTIRGVYQSVVPSAMQRHPLAESVTTWKQLLDSETITGYRAMHKLRLVSAHSWTWQPSKNMLVAQTSVLELHAMREYSSRLGSAIGGLRLSLDPDLGLIASAHAGKQSGWYTPIAWLRLKLRSHMMRRVEHALDHGLDIAYLAIDGMHVRAANDDDILRCCNDFSDPISPWWTWRVDRTFRRGIWLRPGGYALQNPTGSWVLTNLPECITGNDWSAWCQSRGTLDCRREMGYWRRPNHPQAWANGPSISLHAQRHLRLVVRQYLNR